MRVVGRATLLVERDDIGFVAHQTLVDCQPAPLGRKVRCRGCIALGFATELPAELGSRRKCREFCRCEHVSLVHQLQMLLSGEDTFDALNRCQGDRGGMLGGRVAAHVRQQNGLTVDADVIDVIVTIHGDGLLIFGMSPHAARRHNYDAWPIYVRIHNLPLHSSARAASLLLCAMVHGPRQPACFQALLVPLVTELTLLAGGTCMQWICVG